MIVPGSGMKERISLLYSEEQIARRIAELGQEIAATVGDRELCVLGLMKGSLVFMADLIRKLPVDLTVQLVRVTSQRDASRGRVETEIVYSTAVPLEGKDVLLVDDIVDTGITLSYLLAHIHEHGPRSLRVCTLIDKPEARKIAGRRPVPGGLRARLDGALPRPALDRHAPAGRPQRASPGVS
jgi:hypoxanthine phosphoribosyltransferase